MYYIISYNVRPSNAVLYFGQTAAAVPLLSPIFAALAAASTEHLGTRLAAAPSGLFSVNIDKWVSQAAYDTWAALNEEALDAYDDARTVYNSTRSILRTETKFTSTDILF